MCQQEVVEVPLADKGPDVPRLTLARTISDTQSSTRQQLRILRMAVPCDFRELLDSATTRPTRRSLQAVPGRAQCKG